MLWARQMPLFIFFFGKENEPKETARAPLAPACQRIERVSRKLASLRQVREPYPFDTLRPLHNCILVPI
jgi:hypothetical protein